MTVIRGPNGERVVNAEDYWVGPGVDITRMTLDRKNGTWVIDNIRHDAAR